MTYPKTVTCPDVPNLPDYLTAGKVYEVTRANDRGFKFTDDNDRLRYSDWHSECHLGRADWIKNEDETPPEWALKEACALGEESYDCFLAWTKESSWSKSIQAHARTIAKHEQPPVDPVEAAFSQAFHGSEIGSLGGTRKFYRRFKNELAERGVTVEVKL